jgi:tetratricopeptide (TPR) repeat protein
VSDSIALVDHLLTRSRLLARLGRRTEARSLLNRLLDQPELRNGVRAEALRLLANVEVQCGRYRRARRHLVFAIRLTRHSDELYIEYARAIDADPNGDPKKAVKALRRAVSIDPMDVRYWSMLGRMAVAAGDRRLAWKVLRRAARLRPETADVLSEIIEGFLAIGLDREAQEVITAARFRAPAGVDLAALEAEFNFDRAVRKQEAARRDRGAATILPFPQTNREAQPLVADFGVLRADCKSRSVPHVLRMFDRWSKPRQAN